MLVKSPFGRHYTDTAEKLEQSLYCFGGDGDSGSSGGSSQQQADMDKEMAAIDAEFAAMDRAYEAGNSFTSEGVTTNTSDRDNGEPEAVRYDPVTGNYYNFNIDYTQDYTIDEQGRRVYDPELTERNRVSSMVDDIVQLNLQDVRLPYLIDDELKSREFYEQMKIDELQTFSDALDASARPEYEGLGITITPDKQVLVEHPDPMVRGLTKGGAMFASAIPGSLLAGLGGMVAYDWLGLPVRPAEVVIGTTALKAAGTGSLFGKPTFQAQAFLDPLTGETITEQTLNIGGQTVDTRYTSESEFAAMRAEEERLNEMYGSGEVVGDPTGLAEAKTGTRKPSWRDYANTGFDFEKEIFNAFTGGVLPEMPKYIQDGAALTIAISSGQDPLTALIGVYGDDVDDALGLSEMASSALDDLFPAQTAQFLKDNHDLAKLGADIVVYGKDPSEAIRERYGDKLLEYMGADTKNLQAAGNAGLNVLVNLDKGMDTQEAIGIGVVDYFKQGGTVELAKQGGNFLKGVLSDFDLEIPDLNLPDLGINWKETWDNINAKLPEGDFRFANELIPDFGIDGLFDQGFTLEDFNWEAIDTSGMNLGDFNARGYDLADLQDMGVDLPDLNIDIPRLDFELQWAKMTETYPGEKITPEGEMIASLEPDLDFLGDDETPFSRQLLESGKIA